MAHLIDAQDEHPVFNLLEHLHPETVQEGEHVACASRVLRNTAVPPPPASHALPRAHLSSTGAMAIATQIRSNQENLVINRR